MRILTKNEVLKTNGGNLAPLGTFVAVLTVPKIVNDYRKEYNEWGRNLGEYLWESRYPYDPNNPKYPYY